MQVQYNLEAQGSATNIGQRIITLDSVPSSPRGSPHRIHAANLLMRIHVKHQKLGSGDWKKSRNGLIACIYSTPATPYSPR